VMFGSILTAKVSIQMLTDSWMQVIYHGNVYSAECQIFQRRYLTRHIQLNQKISTQTML
jgi:hypothetical protein